MYTKLVDDARLCLSIRLSVLTRRKPSPTSITRIVCYISRIRGFSHILIKTLTCEHLIKCKHSEILTVCYKKITNIRAFCNTKFIRDVFVLNTMISITI